MRYLYFLLTVLVFICICGAIFFTGSNILLFLHYLSALLVLLPSAFLALSSYSFNEIGRAFRSAFANNQTTPVDLQNALLFFTSLCSYVLLSAGIATLIGFIAILGHIGDKSMIGTGVAMSLLSILYALVLLLVIILPFKTGIKKKLIELGRGGDNGVK